MSSTLTSLRLLDTVTHNTLIGKLRMFGLDEWTVTRQMRSWGASGSVWPPHPVLSPGEATSGVLCPVLVSTGQER